MNKRINEIMDECGLWIDYDNREVTKGELEVFAEQIVKECAKLMYAQDHWESVENGNLIKEHFGVEPRTQYW